MKFIRPLLVAAVLALATPVAAQADDYTIGGYTLSTDSSALVQPDRSSWGSIDPNSYGKADETDSYGKASATDSYSLDSYGKS